MAPLVIDPALFRPDAISPETARLNAEVEAFLDSAPTAMELGAPEIRKRRRAGEGLLGFQPPHASARWLRATFGARDVPVRVFEPGGPVRGAILHIHGGGHTLGAADAQDQTLADMAHRLSVAIVSVEYRLAPENPYPAGPDDCETAALWLIQQSPVLFGTDRLMIMGESAGAHLSAVTLIRLRHRHGMMPFSGACLIYGQYDLTGLPAVHAWGERNLVISTPIISWFNANFLPATQYSLTDRRQPDVSPIYADLSGLCPALFICGTLDPLVDDTLLMAQRWSAHGNDTALDLYPGGIHIFNMLPGCALGDAANRRVDEWIDAALPSVI